MARRPCVQDWPVWCPTHRFGMVRSLYLAHRSLRVQVESTLLQPRRITAGVPQGSHLGPVLFTVFINDLPAAVSTSTSLYADDALLYSIFSSARSDAGHRHFQHGILSASSWASSWQGHFSPPPPKKNSRHADWYHLRRHHRN